MALFKSFILSLLFVSCAFANPVQSIGDFITLTNPTINSLNPLGLNNYLTFTDGIIKYKGNGFRVNGGQIFARHTTTNQQIRAIRLLDNFPNPSKDANVLAKVANMEIYVSGNSKFSNKKCNYGV